MHCVRACVGLRSEGLGDTASRMSVRQHAAHSSGSESELQVQKCDQRWSGRWALFWDVVSKDDGPREYGHLLGSQRRRRSHHGGRSKTSFRKFDSFFSFFPEGRSWWCSPAISHPLLTIMGGCTCLSIQSTGSTFRMTVGLLPITWFLAIEACEFGLRLRCCIEVWVRIKRLDSPLQPLQPFSDWATDIHSKSIDTKNHSKARS